MADKVQAEVFIQTLVEMLDLERKRRAAQSSRHNKTHADRFVNWLKGEFGAPGMPAGASYVHAQAGRPSAEHQQNG